MSEQIENLDKNFVPASLAAKQTGYTPDYITRLAREGKIRALKNARQWFVDPEDVITFATQAEAERIARGRELSLARKIEHQQHRKKDKSILLIPSPVVPGRSVAVLHTLLIFTFGLSLGGLTYYSSGQQHQAAAQNAGTSFFEEIAKTFHALIAPRESRFVIEDELSGFQKFTRTSEVEREVQQSRSYSLTLTPSGRAEIVAGAFSDEVAVSFDAEVPENGVIIPRFRDREDREDTEAFKFTIEVPVPEQETQ